jgi:hypothetical protein
MHSQSLLKKPISFWPKDGNPIGRPKLRTAGVFMGEDHEFNLQESANQKGEAPWNGEKVR